MALCRPHLQRSKSDERRRCQLTYPTAGRGNSKDSDWEILAGSGPKEAYLNAQDPVAKLHYRTHEGTHLRILQSRSIGARIIVSALD